MKKAIFAALVLALTCGAFQDSWAAGRTSTTLANSNNLISSIEPDSYGVPLGTAITWPYSGMPQDANNWRECNGQSLNGTRLCTELGQCTAPDYRGMFLRGYGGKSGSLGQIQDSQMGSHKHKMGRWVNRASYYLVWPYNQAGVFWPTTVQHYGAFGNESHYPEHETFTDDESIPTNSFENRPKNIAVRYLIKVN